MQAKRYIRERWVEPVGTMDEPCDADDDGAEAVLRNPDGPEAANTITSLVEALRPFAEQPTIEEALHGPEPWADLSLEERIAKLNSRKAVSTENIMRARQALLSGDGQPQ